MLQTLRLGLLYLREQLRYYLMGTVLTPAREEITDTKSLQACLDTLVDQDMAQLFGNLPPSDEKVGCSHLLPACCPDRGCVDAECLYKRG